MIGWLIASYLYMMGCYNVWHECDELNAILHEANAEIAPLEKWVSVLAWPLVSLYVAVKDNIAPPTKEH